MWEYEAKVLRVVDGDTLDLCVDLGFFVSVSVRARLSGVDTPETYGVRRDSEEYAAGVRATRFVEDWLENSERVKIRSHKAGFRTGKYGRWIVQVYNENEECLNGLLVESGHAKVYGDG